MNRRVLRFAAPLALFLGLLARPQAAEPIATNAAPAKVFLWKIDRAQGGTVYLLGSIHAATPALYPLDRRITDAYARSDALVVEADLLAADPLALAAQLMTRAAYPPGDGLTNHLGPELLQLVAARLAKDGLTLDTFRQLKPWYLAMTITMLELQKLGITADQGIDFHFLQKAHGAKPILELEGPAFQIELLDGFTDKEQAAFLEYTLKDLEQLAGYMKDLVTAWVAGDAPQLAGFLRKALAESPAMAPVYRKLFDDRNVRMAEKLERQLQDGKTYFVVVGAGHVVGPGGLLDRLSKTHRVQQL